ncbi:MAG: DPP IV N-terminal domain-containing protein, partial [Gammaproteobacteria bacterium]|nr:DPP IV N-terminal domain-containing protein [Gammaproteobacteria bacterium]
MYVKKDSQAQSIAKSSEPIADVRWSPVSDELAYIVGHTIWIDNLKTHTDKKWVDFHGSVAALQWAPDGQAIAFTAVKEKKKTDFPIDVSKDYVNVRLYFAPVDSGEAKPLTPESMSVSSQFDFSPDGQSIVFAHRPRNPMDLLNDSSLALVNIKSGLISSVIPSKSDATYLYPFYSPNGEWIAYETNLEPTGHAVMLTQIAALFTRVCVLNVKTKISHCLKNTFNENPQIIGWNASSQSVYVIDLEKTEGMKIYALAIDGVASPVLVSQKIGIVQPNTLTLNSSRTAFGFGYETVSQPPEAYMSRVNPFVLQKISDVNARINSESLGTEKLIHWPSTDGKIIEGLLIMPPHYNPKKSYPLYVDVHGGPDGASWQRYLGDCHDFGIGLQATDCLAPILQEGFVIFQPNPR